MIYVGGFFRLMQYGLKVYGGLRCMYEAKSG